MSSKKIDFYIDDQNQAIESSMKFWDSIDEACDTGNLSQPPTQPAIASDLNFWEQLEGDRADRNAAANQRQPIAQASKQNGKTAADRLSQETSDEMAFWKLLDDFYDFDLSEESPQEALSSEPQSPLSPDLLAALPDRRPAFTVIRETTLLDRLKVSRPLQIRSWIWMTGILSGLALCSTVVLGKNALQPVLVADSGGNSAYSASSLAAADPARSRAAAKPIAQPSPPQASTKTLGQAQTNLTRTNSAQTSSAQSNSAQTDAKTLQQVQAIVDRARRLAQSAQSVDDWRLVVNQWQQAIGKLNAISRGSAYHAAARQQLQAIQNQLAAAQRRANQTVSESPTLSEPNVISMAVSCQPRSSNAGGDGIANPGANAGANAGANENSNSAVPVELTNAAFVEAKPGVETPIVGCITNNTNQPISQVSLVYKGTSTQAPGLFRTGNEEVIATEIKPGETIGFRSRFTISPDISNIEIQAVSWKVADNPEPQTTPITVQITR